MRPTKLVAGSKESFADATRQLITKVVAMSDSIKSLRIVEDTPLAENSYEFNVKAHVLRRK